MCKEGEVRMCHVCFQSIKMAGLLGVEGLRLDIVGDIYYFVCHKQHPHLLWETAPPPFGSRVALGWTCGWAGLSLVTRPTDKSDWSGNRQMTKLGQSAMLRNISNESELEELTFLYSWEERQDDVQSPNSSVRITPNARLTSFLALWAWADSSPRLRFLFCKMGITLPTSNTRAEG